MDPSDLRKEWEAGKHSVIYKLCRALKIPSVVARALSDELSARDSERIRKAIREEVRSSVDKSKRESLCSEISTLADSQERELLRDYLLSIYGFKMVSADALASSSQVIKYYLGIELGSPPAASDRFKDRVCAIIGIYLLEFAGMPEADLATVWQLFVGYVKRGASLDAPTAREVKVMVKGLQTMRLAAVGCRETLFDLFADLAVELRELPSVPAPDDFNEGGGTVERAEIEDAYLDVLARVVMAKQRKSSRRTISGRRARRGRLIEVDAAAS